MASPNAEMSSTDPMLIPLKMASNSPDNTIGEARTERSRSVDGEQINWIVGNAYHSIYLLLTKAISKKDRTHRKCALSGAEGDIF